MRYLKILLAVVLTHLSVASLANHVLGGNISYECLGGDTYGVTLTIYKDCFGATPAPATETIFFIAQSGGCLAFSAQASLISEVEISDLCASELDNSSCSGGLIPGTQQLTYYLETNLVGAFIDPSCVWELSWGSGDWNYFQNIDNSLLPNAYIQTILDPTFGCNSSATVSSMQVPYWCADDVVSHQVTTNIPAGFSVDYSLTGVLTTGGVTAPYELPYTPADQITGITIDNITGQIDFTAPAQFGTYVVGIQIDVYDGAGNLVSTMIEAMTFVIKLCQSSPTLFTLPEIQAAHADVTVISDNEAEVCVGDSLCLTVEATNANLFRSIDVTTDFDTFFPGADIVVTGLNPAVMECCIEIDETMIGTHVITFDAMDDACDNPSADQITITVYVSPSLTVDILDITICNGGTLDIVATGDVDYDWNVISGTDPGFVQGQGTQSLIPIDPLQVEIIAPNASMTCNWRDTLNVDVSLWSITGIVVDESCLQNDGSIDLSPLGGSGNYSFDWEAGTYITEDITGISGGQDWTVEVTDIDNSCVESATFTVDTSPPPSGSISGNITICEGDCADISFTFSGTPTFDVVLMNTTTAVQEVTPALSNGDVFQVCPTATSVYELQSLTDSNLPQCTYSVPSQVTVTVRPIVNATIIDPGSLCDGDVVDLELDIDQVGTYLVDYTIDAVAQPQLNATDADLINITVSDPSTTVSITNVAYTDAPTCDNAVASTLVIDVDPLPTAALTGATTICDGEDITLHISLTGTGPWTVSYTENGVAQADLVVAFNEWDWLISPGPSVDTQYCLTNVADQNCAQALVGQCVDITVNSNPTGTITSNGTICAGDSYDIDLTLGGNGPFTIVVEDSGGNAVGGIPATVANGDQFSVTPAANEVYCLIEIIDDNGCDTDLLECVTVNVNPLPTIDIDGSTSICNGDCYDVVLAGLSLFPPYNVVWELQAADDGAVLDSGTAMAVNNGSVVQVCPTEDASFVIISVTDSGVPACTNDSPGTQFDINVSNYATVEVSQDSTICEGGTPLLTFCFTNYAPADLLTVNLDNGQGFVILGADLIADCWNFSPIMADPSVAQTFTISNFSNDQNACTDILVDNVTISVNPVPAATLLADMTICPGGDAEIEIDITTVGGPYDIEITDIGGTATTFVGVVDGDTFVFNPAASETYTLTLLTDNSTMAACSSMPMSAVDVTIADLVQIVLPVDTLCADTGDEFQIEFEITGGDPTTYVVTPTQGNDPGGSDPTIGAPYIYTSGILPTGTTETWEVTDGFGCAPATFDVGLFDCPIVTYSGTLDLTAQFICDDGVLCVTHNLDEILDGNDVLNYVITDSGVLGVLGTVYDISIANCWTVGVDLMIPADVAFDTQYYVAVIAGTDANLDGLVDNLASSATSISEGVPVTFLDTPDASISGDATLCAGEDATLVVDFTGSMNYNFELLLDGVPQGPINGFDMVQYTEVVTAPGVYTLNYINNTYCTGVAAGSATVVVNPLPTVSISGGGIICEGDALDLDIDLTGTAPWDIIVTYDDGINPPVDTPVDGIAATPEIYVATADGSYSVTSVTDDNGCENSVATAAVVVDVNPLPTAIFAFGDSSLCTGSTIDLEFLLTGTGPWTLEYSVDAVAQPVIGSAVSPILETIGTGGDYCIEQLADANGCLNTTQSCINVAEIPIPLADAGPDLNICSQIEAPVGTPGDPTLDYLWTGDTQILSDAAVAQPLIDEFNDTGANLVYNLTLTVEDSQCSATDDVVVTIEFEPIADAGPDVLLCYGDTYQLGAIGGVNCQWVDNGTFIDPTGICDPIVQPFVDTQYNVTVSGANLCTAEDSLMIVVSPEFTVVEDFTPTVCFEACVATIDLIPNGGFGDYSVDWGASSLTDLNETGVCGGTYDYTVSDSVGCFVTGTIIVAEWAQNYIDDVVIAAPACFGTTTGAVSVDDNEAESFTLVGGATNFTGNFFGLGAGAYTFSTTDMNNCVADTTISFVSQSPEIFINAAFDTTVVCVGDAVDFSAAAIGGTPAFTYNWYDANPPGGVLLGSGLPYTAVPNDTLTVWVVATDATGCNSDTLQMTSVFDPVIEVFASPNFEIEICQGECVDLDVTTLGGNGNITVEWYLFDTFAPQLLGSDPSYEVCPMEGSAYIVYANDGCQIEATDTVFVIVHETPEVVFSPNVYNGCFPLTITLTNETDPFLVENCLWDFGDGTLVPICDTISYTYVFEGEYWPALTVTSDQGCSSTDTLDVPIEVYGYPDPDFYWEPFPVTTLENDIQFINTTIGAVEYDWNLSSAGVSQLENPSAIFPPINLATYTICLEATNEFGCSDTVCHDIFMESLLQIFVPTAFTPDQDGLNDVFLPILSGVFEDGYLFRVFDRWGDIVFETEKMGEPWVGNVKRGEHFAQNDVYVWQIEVVELATGDKKRFYGHVTLVR
jgi:gliding motility-associated-like protein